MHWINCYSEFHTIHRKLSNSRMCMFLLLVLTTEGSSNDPPRTDPTSTRPSTQPTSSKDSTVVSRGLPGVTDPRHEREPSYFVRCFHLAEKAWPVPPLDTARWNFTTEAPHICWVYCQHLTSCEALAFDYLNSACFLFELNLPIIELGPPDRNIGTLHKPCVEHVEKEQSSIDLEEAIQVGKKGRREKAS